MSYSTKPAFVYEGNWSAETDSHPAMNWMHQFTVKCFDARDWDCPATTWLIPDYTLKKPDGVEHHGAEDGWAAQKALYDPFTEHKHEPQRLMCAENKDGWEMIGIASLFVNIPGSASAGESKVKDLEGKQWDTKVQSAFRFVYVKDESGPQGIKLKRTEIYSDPLPALGLLLKRGVMKPEQLLG